MVEDGFCGVCSSMCSRRRWSVFNEKMLQAPTGSCSLPDTFRFRSATRTSIPSQIGETVSTGSAQPDSRHVAEYPSTTSSPAETGFYHVDQVVAQISRIW